MFIIWHKEKCGMKKTQTKESQDYVCVSRGMKVRLMRKWHYSKGIKVVKDLVLNISREEWFAKNVQAVWDSKTCEYMTCLRNSEKPAVAYVEWESSKR